jgi:hypothetical protein
MLSGQPADHMTRSNENLMLGMENATSNESPEEKSAKPMQFSDSWPTSDQPMIDLVEETGRNLEPQPNEYARKESTRISPLDEPLAIYDIYNASLSITSEPDGVAVEQYTGLMLPDEANFSQSSVPVEMKQLVLERHPTMPTRTNTEHEFGLILVEVHQLSMQIA